MASARDLAEIARSASEASKVKILDVELARYQTPSADTCYALEYAFYLLGDVHNKLVVDLGCGSGEEVVPLQQRGARVIGIDISPHLIAIAHERLRKYGVDAELRIASAYETHGPRRRSSIRIAARFAGGPMKPTVRVVWRSIAPSSRRAKTLAT